MQDFDNINPAEEKAEIVSEMEKWLSFDTEAGKALKKVVLLGSFLHRGTLWYAAWFTMDQNYERPAGKYIIIQDEFGSVLSEFLSYDPETALDTAKKTADSLLKYEKMDVDDPLYSIGFASGEPKSYKKTPEEIVRRAVAGLLVSQILPETEDARVLCRTLLDLYGVKDELLEEETKFLLKDGKVSEEDIVRVSWYSEAVYAILWAAGLHDKYIICCGEAYDAEQTANIIKNKTLDELIKKVCMRDIKLVINTMVILHDIEMYSGKAGEIAVERLRGLSWLFSDAKDWGHMMLESRIYD